MGRSNLNRWNRRALSLVELLVVMGIISILLSMLLVTVGKVYHVVDGFRHH